MKSQNPAAALLLLGSLLALGVAPVLADQAVVVSEPYARAVPPGQPNSAVFMQIDNGSDQDLALVGAASPVAKVVELHTHRLEDGMMKMRRVEQIDLPAGSRVSLQPGGLHLMLIGLKQQLRPGEDVAVSLTLDDGSELALSAPVREILPMGQMHGGH
jgi:copper(I)-binding protein